MDHKIQNQTTESEEAEYRQTDGSTPGLAGEVQPSVFEMNKKLQQERSPFAVRSKKFESFGVGREQPLSGLYLNTNVKREKSLFSTPSIYQLDKLKVDIPDLGTSDSGDSIS